MSTERICRQSLSSTDPTMLRPTVRLSQNVSRHGAAAVSRRWANGPNEAPPTATRKGKQAPASYEQLARNLCLRHTRGVRLTRNTFARETARLLRFKEPRYRICT